LQRDANTSGEEARIWAKRAGDRYPIFYHPQADQQHPPVEMLAFRTLQKTPNILKRNGNMMFKEIDTGLTIPKTDPFSNFSN
jgi:hypothetical protein